MLGNGVSEGLRVRMMFSVEDRGYIACKVGFITSQLICPDAYTRGFMLHVRVLFSSLVSPAEDWPLGGLPELVYADWQATDV